LRFLKFSTIILGLVSAQNTCANFYGYFLLSDMAIASEGWISFKAPKSIPHIKHFGLDFLILQMSHLKDLFLSVGL